MKKLCEQCGQKDCGFVNRGMEDDCEKVQWYQQGHDDAVDKACKWLKNTLPPAIIRSDYYMFNGSFIRDFKKAMEGGKE